jgi:hypothetical protein
MDRTQIAPTLEEILENMRELSDKEQRQLAASVAADRKLEPFVEELEDTVASERASEEGAAEPFVAEEFNHP